ncbi:hypothetical protein BYT27DRAFT_7159584 [Phlegmacium glaucopus]|nr:hypothetical protein BYT27DRAFT_7159584 [Phlegmacium glaucopus]
MSMLACVRRRVQSVLPRPHAFSTLPPRQEDVRKLPAHSDPILGDLASMLVKYSGSSPIIPGINHTDQRWNSFRANRVINPADLTYQTRTYEPRRPKKSNVALPSSTCRYRDPFYQLDLDPRDFTANPLVLSEYLSEMGKIQGRAHTHLTAKNQRLLGKTIRRAKMMGIIPHLSILTSADRTSRLKRR